MAIEGELITAEVTEIDRERQATLDLIDGIAFHMKVAEKDAIECPDARGRELFRNIAIEFRNLAIMLHATTDGTDESQESMDTFYRVKADECFEIQTKEAAVTSTDDVRGAITRLQSLADKPIQQVVQIVVKGADEAEMSQGKPKNLQSTNVRPQKRQSLRAMRPRSIWRPSGR